MNVLIKVFFALVVIGTMFTVSVWIFRVPDVVSAVPPVTCDVNKLTFGIVEADVVKLCGRPRFVFRTLTNESNETTLVYGDAGPRLKFEQDRLVRIVSDH